MLNARYPILDSQEWSGNEILKHPVSGNQYPGSIFKANGFPANTRIPMQNGMQHQRLLWRGEKRLSIENDPRQDFEILQKEALKFFYFLGSLPNGFFCEIL